MKLKIAARIDFYFNNHVLQNDFNDIWRYLGIEDRKSSEDKLINSDVLE